MQILLKIIVTQNRFFIYKNLIGNASKTINVNGFEGIIYRVQQILKSSMFFRKQKKLGVIF